MPGRYSAYILWIGWLLSSFTSFAQSSGITFDFSNDVWDKTDRYYTQGMRLLYISPGLAKPVNYLFPKLASGASDVTASVEAFQDLYTPSVYNTNVYNPNDRPYAAVLAGTYRYFRQSANAHSLFQLNGTVGVIGKGALGEETQNKVHDIIDNLDALGWGYQLKTGLLINAGTEWEHNLVNTHPFRLSGLGAAQFGTYKTNAQVGLTIYLENNPTFYSIPLLKDSKKFQQQLIVQDIFYAMGYDATLQGAMFQDYTYGLASDKIKRLTMQAKAEYRLLFHSFQFGVCQYIQSPQFDGAFWHKWVTIRVGYCF